MDLSDLLSHGSGTGFSDRPAYGPSKLGDGFMLDCWGLGGSLLGRSRPSALVVSKSISLQRSLVIHNTMLQDSAKKASEIVTCQRLGTLGRSIWTLKPKVFAVQVLNAGLGLEKQTLKRTLSTTPPTHP